MFLDSSIINYLDCPLQPKIKHP